MPLISSESNLILIYSADCVIASHTAANEAATFEILDTKLYVPMVTLLTNDNAKLLQ